MSADLAPDQLRAFVDRILRLKAEQDALATDIKEVYAEAKGNGYDKTVLGALVSHLRRVEKAPEKVAEAEDLFDIYLSAYENAPRTHVHVPARTHTRGNEAARGDQGDGVEAATAAPSQSVEKIAPDVTAEGDGPRSATGPAPVEGVGSNLPGGASEMDRDGVRLTDREAQPQPEGQTAPVAAENALEAPAIGRAGRVSHAEPGESPGALSPERAARLAAFEAEEAERRRHRPLPPEGLPLREIILAAREGRSLGVPAAEGVSA